MDASKYGEFILDTKDFIQGKTIGKNSIYKELNSFNMKEEQLQAALEVVLIVSNRKGKGTQQNQKIKEFLKIKSLEIKAEFLINFLKKELIMFTLLEEMEHTEVLKFFANK